MKGAIVSVEGLTLSLFYHSDTSAVELGRLLAAGRVVRECWTPSGDRTQTLFDHGPQVTIRLNDADKLKEYAASPHIVRAATPENDSDDSDPFASITTGPDSEETA